MSVKNICFGISYNNIFKNINNKTTQQVTKNSNIEAKSDDLGLSMDYFDKNIQPIAFDISEYSSCLEGKLNIDHTANYGDILDEINSNSTLNDTQKDELKNVLDNEYDKFADKASEKLTNDISNFFGSEDNINKDELKKNIKSMFKAAEVFYKNNPKGTAEERDEFLQDRFSNTQSLTNLGYNDFKALNNAIKIAEGNGRVIDLDNLCKNDNSNEIKQELRDGTSALEELAKGGTSITVQNAFKKVVEQKILSTIENSCYLEKNLNMDYTANYGKALDEVNASTSISNTQKKEMKSILEIAYDKFADKASEKIANDTETFFDIAYYAGQDEFLSKLGITGDKLIDKNEFQKTVRNMFEAAKDFYKNNPNGTEEERDKFLEDKFSSTKSLENLSYVDFKSIDKAIKNMTDNEIEDGIGLLNNPKAYLDKMNTILDKLVKDGASSFTQDVFKKAIKQDYNYNVRFGSYFKLEFQFEEGNEEDAKELAKIKDKLKELEKRRKEMMEMYRKKVQKAEEEIRNSKIKISLLDGDRIIQDINKQREEKLKDLDDEKKDLLSQEKSIRSRIDKRSKQHDDFVKNPKPYIDNYIKRNNLLNNQL